MSLHVTKRKATDDFEEAKSIKCRSCSSESCSRCSWKTQDFFDIQRAYADACHGNDFEQDLAKLKFFVELGCNPQKAVFSVCKAGSSVEMLQFLGKAGADLRYDDDWPLQLACEFRHIDLVQELVLNHGANVKANFNAPLRRAIESNSVDIVKFLVEHGAHDGKALDCACLFENEEIARYFHSLDEFKTQEVSSSTVLTICQSAEESWKYDFERPRLISLLKFLVSIGAKLSAKAIDQETSFLIPNHLGRTTPAQLLRKCVLDANVGLYDFLVQLICD